MRVQKRRKRKGKTDYLKRLKLLKGNLPRIVFRKTNRYIIGQYITSKEAKDKIEVGVSSKHLLKYGWPKDFEGSLKSIPASYLTGLLIGKKIIERKLNTPTPIVDFGMTRALHKTRAYAFIKGLIDSGVKIKHKEKDIFPSEDRIKGKHLKKALKEFNEIKTKIEKE